MNELNILSPVYMPMVGCTEGNKDILFSRWRSWEKQCEPGEHRDMAIKILTDCLNRETGIVDLSGLGLRSLPDLPSSIEYLNIDDNDISYLEGLPENLRIMHANMRLIFQVCFCKNTKTYFTIVYLTLIVNRKSVFVDKKRKQERSQT